MARGNGYMIALESGSATIGFLAQVGSSRSVSMEFAGARKVSGTAGPELPGKVNYLLGNNPKQWRFGLSTYSSVTYREIYHAIDVVYRGNQRQMEFDLVLRPGADPKQIRLKFSEVRALTLDGDGALVIRSAAGDLRIPLPVVYQEVAGVRKTIRGHYGLLPNHEVGFRLDDYDHSHPLVIDPTLVYAGLIGGGTNSTSSRAIALDSSSNAYIAGYTYASDFPTANAAYPLAHVIPDGFVSKIDPTGTTLLYSTYIGGGGYDYFSSIAVDSTGAAWVAGYTASADFPVLNAYQSTLNTANGGYDAVALKLSPTGTLAYSTYLGSNSFGTGVAVDPSGNAYVAGYVAGTFPTTSGAYLATSAGGYDGFVTKFNSGGTLSYSTYLGGAGTDVAYAIAADAGGNTYITGYTYSTAFTNAPTGGAYTSPAGIPDVFVTKLNAAGSALGYFTFLGGSQAEAAYSIAVDSSGNAYIGGATLSANFPATVGAFQTVSGGGTDGFVAKLNSTGSAFTYVTYLGGHRQDYVQSLAIDGSGNAFVTGYTDSSQFPTAASIQGGLLDNAASLYRTTDSGASWNPLEGNIQGAVTSISPDPGTPAVLVATTEAGIFRSTNTGVSWTLTSTLGNAYVSRSPASSSTVYAISCCTQIYRSTDGGATWSSRGTLGTSANRIVADPLTVNTAYAYNAQNSNGLYKSTDGGATWTSSSTGLPNVTTIYSLVAASDGSLYVDLFGWGVYKSTNHGASWVAATSGLATLTAPLNGLAVSASNPSILYKGVNGTVIYKTTNGGTSWTASGTAPVALGAVGVSVSNPALVYASALSGSPTLYVSQDSGATWSPAGTGLEVARLTQIVPDPSSGTSAYALAQVANAAFVTKINPSGNGLVYSTYLGGSDYTYGYGIAVNSSSDAFVTGTNYGTFPVTTSLPGTQSSYNAFVARISGTTASCSFSVSPATQIVYSDAAVLSYSVVAPSGCAWTASSNQLWATIAGGASGSGSGLVSVAVSANTTGATRVATLTIGGQTPSLTQAPSSCSYTLGTPAVSLGVSGGSVQTTVTTGAGCPWSVVNNYPSAISVVSGASGTGSGTVMLNVASNAQQTTRSMYVPIGSATLAISQSGYCSYALSPSNIPLSSSGGSGSVTVTTPSGCPWTASSTDPSWLTVTSGSSGIGDGTFNYSALPTGSIRSASLAVGSATVTVSETAPSPLRFVPITPCRIADTRNATGPFGGPAISGGTSRDFTVPSSACGVPANAQGYSLNVTVVPSGSLGYLTLWPAGRTRPLASTLNSLDGRIKSNAAIIPAGTSGAVSVFASDTTNVVLDINGYFVPATDPTALAFYPITPCRIADTRQATGSLGGPSLSAGQSRTFPILSSTCNIPATAQAYSLNFAAVPSGRLGYLTAWPTGLAKPLVSSLNAPTGAITANGAIVPAGTNGSIDVFASDATNLVIDINGYFAPVAAGGLSLYPMTPCRILDTRKPTGSQPITTLTVAVTSSACGIPATAKADVFSVTVVPPAGLGYLTLWPQGQTQPVVSTLNALDAAITSNLAIVPTTNGSISAFASNPTHLVMDILGYFAP